MNLQQKMKEKYSPENGKKIVQVLTDFSNLLNKYNNNCIKEIVDNTLILHLIYPEKIQDNRYTKTKFSDIECTFAQFITLMRMIAINNYIFPGIIRGDLADEVLETIEKYYYNLPSKDLSVCISFLD